MDSASKSLIPHRFPKADNPIFTVQFSEEDQARINLLKTSIPANIQGALEFLVDESGSTPILTGIRIQPDPVLQTLTALYQYSPDAAHNNHTMHYHETRNIRDYTGEKFEAICAHLCKDDPLDQVKAKHWAAIKSAHVAPHNVPLHNVGINGAMNQPLTAETKQLLQKIQAAIPADLRGFFICVLSESPEHPGKKELDQLVVNPVAAMKIIGAYTDHRLSHGEHTHSIPREELMAIAQKLPQPGHKIG